MSTHKHILTKNITGASSGIVYGKAGESILVIENKSGMYLVQNEKHKFYVFEHEFTEKPAEPDNNEEIVVKEVTESKKQNRSPAPENPKSSPSQKAQQTLF